MWEEFDCVGYTVRLCFVDVGLVASVMLHGGAGVPSSVAVGVPRQAFVGFDMYYNLGSWWCQWCSIKIERTIDLSVGGELWVHA
jgi:hypothetical protein